MRALDSGSAAVRDLVVSLDFHDAVAARIANEFLYAPTPFELRWVTNLVVCRWWLRLEWLVPPPIGALAGGSGAGRDRGRGFRRWAGKRSRAEWSAGAVGDGQIVWGSSDGDDTPMVQPVMIGADQHQVGQLGGAAVFPVPDVVCV
jgi:hypothetical protein